MPSYVLCHFFCFQATNTPGGHSGQFSLHLSHQGNQGLFQYDSIDYFEYYCPRAGLFMDIRNLQRNNYVERHFKWALTPKDIFMT